MTTTVVLPEVPALGGLFARGAGLSLARRVRSGPSVLPDVEYVVRGVRASSEHLTEYQHLLGESASRRAARRVRARAGVPRRDRAHGPQRLPAAARRPGPRGQPRDAARPVLLTDVLDVRATATDLRGHRSGTQVDLVTEVSVDGSVAWRGVSTYLARGVFLAGSVEETSDAFVPPTPTGRWKLDGDVGRRYAAVSGDRNPIHLSALSAKALGFPRAIAHGMYTASRALADVGAGRGDAFEWSVEFVKPVLLPGTVTVRIARSSEGFAFAGWDARSGKPHLTGLGHPAALSRASRPARTAGHSSGRIEKYALSPRVPSGASRWLRRTPSGTAPRRRIAAIERALRASARNATRAQPHVSNACVSISSLQAGLFVVPHQRGA